MNKEVVKIKGLGKKIDDITILDNINFNAEEGIIYGIIGTNGSGKSMLFKSICGLIKPTEGEVFVFNKKIDKGQLAENTGVIIEKPGFLPQYSAFSNLKMLASINNVITEEEIKNVISLVGLNPNDKRPISKYSLGMKQRLAIAQAIMEKPKLLLLDEPMNALDEEGVELVRKILLNLKNESVTIIITSHNKEDIETLCDKVYKMASGRLVELI